RRLHTRCLSDWSSDVCSSDLWYNPFATVHTFETILSKYGAAGAREYLIDSNTVKPRFIVSRDGTNIVAATWGTALTVATWYFVEIRRASCRERGETEVDADRV